MTRGRESSGERGAARKNLHERDRADMRRKCQEREMRKERDVKKNKKGNERKNETEKNENKND